MGGEVEQLGENRVRLTVDVSPHDIKHALEHAASDLEASVKIPGFRKGKVPRQIIDAQIGRDAVLEDFVNESVPTYYRDAVREEDLAPITEPDIDLTQLEDGKPLIFTAEMEIRPRLQLEDYEGIEVTRPPVEAIRKAIESRDPDAADQGIRALLRLQRRYVLERLERAPA